MQLCMHIHCVYLMMCSFLAQFNTHAACSNSSSSASSISTGLLAGLVIGWILFIATLIVFVISIVFLFSRRHVYGTKIE